MTIALRAAKNGGSLLGLVSPKRFLAQDFECCESSLPAFA